MKKIFFASILLFVVHISYGQNPTPVKFSPCENVTAFNKNSNPDLGIIIYSDDAETVWNAMRLAVYSQSKGDSVVVFVTGKGVDAYMKTQNDSDIYNIQIISDKFLSNGGNIYACATCAKTRETEEIQSCTITSIADMYQIIMRSKKLVTF